MEVKVRFAPSPTGNLHIGSARTALFNWLYAEHTKGTFLLRIEDTDKVRCSEIYLKSLLQDLEWLGFKSKNKIVYQSERIKRHQEVAYQLLNCGKAYKTDISEKGYIVRLKAPKIGEIVFEDIVYGNISVKAEQLDDMVLLCSDGTPTYMLAVVVDDYDEGITHVIRGADHISNTPRQLNLYNALNWKTPIYAHVPLIYGSDSTKLSKRHGATSITDYREMGFLPQAIKNYLLRLGWSHGDNEIISEKQAIEWFDIKNLNTAPAIFDINKLKNLNSFYIKNLPNEQLFSLLLPFLELNFSLSSIESRSSYLKKALDSLKKRASTLKEIAEIAYFYIEDIKFIEDELKQYFNPNIIQLIADKFQLVPWEKNKIVGALKNISAENNLAIQSLYQTLRVALTGSMHSPPLFEIFDHLGKEETIRKLEASYENCCSST